MALGAAIFEDGHGVILATSDENTKRTIWQVKYSRLELERRFLIGTAPAGIELGPGFSIEDRYIQDTRLRLRKIDGPEGSAYKLTQKYASHGDPAVCVITNIYLDRSEYLALKALPGKVLRKSRRRFTFEGRNFALDVYEGPLAGLRLAETEF